MTDTKPKSNDAIRFEATREGIRISVDICRIILGVLEKKGIDYPTDDGGSLKEYLKQVVDDPLRDALDGKRFGIVATSKVKEDE